jgi:hypothetical protein
VLNGSKDTQVTPKENLAAIANALKTGGNRNYTGKELPGLNHLFQTASTGSPDEYGLISETMAPVVLKSVSNWIAMRVNVGKSKYNQGAKSPHQPPPSSFIASRWLHYSGRRQKNVHRK